MARVGFFAKENIRACEELGYLRDKNATTKGKYSEIKCLCGAAARGGKCRGFL